MKEEAEKKSPEVLLCPVFGSCGGCSYQDIPYSLELEKKGVWLREKVKEELNLDESLLESVVPSPDLYAYRHRLDLGLRKLKNGELLIGFVDPRERKLIEIRECNIARREISDFIPVLREMVKAKLPPDYRRANLTIKTGDDGRVLWGGIGRKSHHLEEKDYLWTMIEGKKIFYSLDHFFQANHSILPSLFEVLKREMLWSQNSVFFDLYGGVGLFSLVLAPLVKKVILVEESKNSVDMAHYNVKQQGYEHFEIIRASVETCLKECLEQHQHDECVAMVDPPRKGLATAAREALKESRHLKHLIYLSCNPESLMEDLKDFLKSRWRIRKMIPFDFFPRTKHLETLVFLEPGC